MTIASSYARALHALVTENPKKGGVYLKNLTAILARRGHQKLLRPVFAEYQKIELHDERLLQHSEVTPHKERTRILSELYRALTKHHG